MSKQPPRTEVSARHVSALGMEYKFKYHLAQDLRISATTKTAKGEHVSLACSRQANANPLYNPEYPPQAMIAQAISNTQHWAYMQESKFQTENFGAVSRAVLI